MTVWVIAVAHHCLVIRISFVETEVQVEDTVVGGFIYKIYHKPVQQ